MCIFVLVRENRTGMNITFSEIEADSGVGGCLERQSATFEPRHLQLKPVCTNNRPICVKVWL